MIYTISNGEYKGERYIPDHVRISDKPQARSHGANYAVRRVKAKTKKSILRIVETGEVKEFESRSDMCEFMEIHLNSLGKYMNRAIDGVFTIRKKQYEVIK